MRHLKRSKGMAALCGLLAGAALLLSSEAGAWGHFGHEAIGAMADALIAGTPAGLQVKSILGSETLEQASLWPDCARNVNDSTGKYAHNDLYPECDVFETPAGIAQFEDFVQRNRADCHPTGEQQICHKQYHFADVAIQRDSYDTHDIGTNDHDVVHAIKACIAVLKGQVSPAPFNIKDKQEALRLLAHFVGDVHQPLHVGAVYLSTKGKKVDPDSSGLDPQSATRGGNALWPGTSSKGNLHSEWDTVPASLQVPAFKSAGVTLARAVPVTAGPVEDWPATWASETVLASQKAYAPLNYGKEVSAATTNRHWPLTQPAGYATKRRLVQKTQLVKAGARLAQVLEAVWPGP